MSEKKKYVVKESFRYGGQSNLPGASIELTAEEAIELAAFLEGETPAVQTQAGSGDQAAIIAALKKEFLDLQGELEEVKKQLAVEVGAKAGLSAELEQKNKDFIALQSANNKTADELKASKEKLAALGKELGDLKKAAKGGNK